MKLIPKKLLTHLRNPLKKVMRYRLILFIVFIAGVYGFVLLEISSLSDSQPNSDAVTSQLSHVRPPKIDQTVVKQLQALQDNSVSVQSLFEQARNNPFEE